MFKFIIIAALIVGLYRSACAFKQLGGDFQDRAIGALKFGFTSFKSFRPQV